MPISIGSISVSKIGLGGVNVTKGYLGTNLVFGGTNCSYLSVVTIPKQYYYVTRVSAGSGIFVAVASQYAEGQQVVPGIYGHVIYISEDGNNWTPVYGPAGSTGSPYVGQLTVHDIATFPNSEVFYIVGSINETYGTYPNQTTYGRVYALLQKTFVQGQEEWNFTMWGSPPSGYSNISLETADIGVNSNGGAAIGIALTGAGQAPMSYIFNPSSYIGGGFNNITATNTGGIAYVTDVAVGGPEVNNLIVAVGANSGLSVRNFMTSLNGVTWTYRDAPQSNWWTGVAWGNGKFVAVARSGSIRVATSTDGITWTGQTAAENNYWTAVAYGGGWFVAVANQGTNRMMASADGIRWFSVAGVPEGLNGDIEYGNGKFIVCAPGGNSSVILFDPVNYMNCTILVETITIQSTTAQMSGSNRVLTVAATLTTAGGLATENDLDYQWQYAAVDSNTWTNIVNASGSVSGANTANLTLTDTYLNAYPTRQHRVVVSSFFAAESVTSTAVAGLNSSNITITQQPQNTTTATATASFSVSATSNDGAVLSYQWEKETSPNQFSTLSGKTSSTLTLTGLTEADNGVRYRVIVDSPTTVPVTSTAATLSVTFPVITFTIQPQNATADLDACYYAPSAPNDPVPFDTTQTALFSALASTSIGSQTFQWQTSSDNGISWTNISNNRLYQTYTNGGESSLWLYSYATPTGMSNLSNGYRYRLVATSTTNPAIIVTSNAVTLTVPVPTMTITQHPTNVTTTGTAAGFSVQATKNFDGFGWQNGFSYQWQRSNDNGDTWTNWMEGPTYYQPTLQLSNLTTGDSGSKWRCQVYSYIFCGGNQVFVSAYSNVATLTKT